MNITPKDIIAEAKYCQHKLGYYPNIFNPESFNEHVLINKIYLRDQLLVTTTDKVAVNEYVIKYGYAETLIPNYFITDNPTEIPFSNLPNEYIVKPNQLSGSIIHYKQGNISKEEIIKKCNIWLKERHYGKNRLVWPTSKIEPKIMVQKVIADNPIDYKIHMIKNRVAFISVVRSESIGSLKKTTINYTADWLPLPFTLVNPRGKEIDKPKNYYEMLRIAEQLSRPFNYVRVDLYNIDGKIYFGELTHYPHSGAGRFAPRNWDYYYGAYFKI